MRKGPPPHTDPPDPPSGPYRTSTYMVVAPYRPELTLRTKLLQGHALVLMIVVPTGIIGGVYGLGRAIPNDREGWPIGDGFWHTVARGLEGVGAGLLGLFLLAIALLLLFQVYLGVRASLLRASIRRMSEEEMEAMTPKDAETLLEEAFSSSASRDAEENRLYRRVWNRTAKGIEMMKKLEPKEEE